MTMILTGALAALAFSAATAHADLDAPTPIGDGVQFHDFRRPGPSLDKQLYDQDFSVLNAPDETFEGVVRFDQVAVRRRHNYNVSVEQDISGNVPVGEQYNDFNLGLSLTASARSTTTSAARRRLSSSRRSVTSTSLPGSLRR